LNNSKYNLKRTEQKQTTSNKQATRTRFWYIYVLFRIFKKERKCSKANWSEM